MKGVGKVLDEYLNDTRATYHDTYRSHNIKFHDPTNEDPDYLPKQCVLAIIAAASEIETGFNCWKSGPSGGRKIYPDFGKYVGKNVMKAFVSAFPFAWAKKNIGT